MAAAPVCGGEADVESAYGRGPPPFADTKKPTMPFQRAVGVELAVMKRGLTGGPLEREAASKSPEIHEPAGCRLNRPCDRYQGLGPGSKEHQQGALASTGLRQGISSAWTAAGSPVSIAVTEPNHHDRYVYVSASATGLRLGRAPAVAPLGPEGFGPYRLVPTCANGSPAFGFYARGEAAILHVLLLDGERIAAMTNFLNPALFPRFGLRATL
jgi:hypothetical protein